VLSSRINSKVKAIWKKLRNKEYRESFVASQISNTIAAQIFSLREARGWKQAEVAARAGMKQSRISDLEDPNYENYETRTLVKLASAFDVGLVVRFVPFSELVKWSANLSPRDFLPKEFLKDMIIPDIEDMRAKELGTKHQIAYHWASDIALSEGPKLVAGNFGDMNGIHDRSMMASGQNIVGTPTSELPVIGFDVTPAVTPYLM
jgi:transcriptional regulator with XRE-family HTH domain